MRKFLKGVATAIMAAILSVTCLGATSALADGYDKTVTFAGVSDNDVVNVYTLVTYNGSYNGYSFDANFAKYLRSRNDVDDSADDAALAQYLQSFGGKSNELTALLKEYANSWTPEDSPATPVSLSKTAGVDPNTKLGPGYYLVLPSTGAESSMIYNPLSVFVRVNGTTSTIAVNGQEGQDVSSLTVNMKSEKGPQIQKYVLRADSKTLRTTKTVAVGDTVTYVVKLTLPDYTNFGNPSMTLHDELRNLTYVDGSLKVYSSFTENKDFDKANLIDDAAAVEDNKTTGNVQSLSFKLDHSKLRSVGERGEKDVYITYQATVDQSIVTSVDATSTGTFVGTNTAQLVYSTSALPESQSVTTNSCKTSVFTYAFRLDKLDNNNAGLTGAKFKVYSQKGDGEKQLMHFKKVEDGYYVPVVAGTVGAIDEVSADCGQDQNQLYVRGVDPFDTYYIEESATPQGFYAPKDQFKISLKSEMLSENAAEHSGNLADDSVVSAVDTADNGLLGKVSVDKATLTMPLRNSNLPVLPTTGGMGTALFTIGGVALMVVAAVAFVLIRKRSEQK